MLCQDEGATLADARATTIEKTSGVCSGASASSEPTSRERREPRSSSRGAAVGSSKCVQLLVEAGASTATKTEGSPGPHGARGRAPGAQVAGKRAVIARRRPSIAAAVGKLEDLERAAEERRPRSITEAAERGHEQQRAEIPESAATHRFRTAWPAKPRGRRGFFCRTMPAPSRAVHPSMGEICDGVVRRQLLPAELAGREG